MSSTLQGPDVVSSSPGAAASGMGWLATGYARYGMAAAVSLAALALKLSLGEWFVPPYILFYPSVMLAAVLGGLGPGLLATGLCAVLAAGWVIPAQLRGYPWTTPDLVGLVVFAVMGTLMTLVAEQSRRSRRTLARYHQERGHLEEAALLRKREDLAVRRYELLATHARDLILFIRLADLRVLDANQAAVEAYGYSRQELLGLSADQLRAPELGELPPGQLADADQGLRLETRHRRKDGSTFPAEVTTRGVTLDGTRLLVSVVRDITERRAHEEALASALAASDRSRAQLEAVFHAVSDGVGVADASGTLVLVNEAEARINGFASVEDMKKNLAYFAEVYELTDAGGAPVPVEQWPLSRVLRGESIADQELGGRRKDTGQRWVFSFSGEPIRGADGTVSLAVVVTRDITRRKGVEEALRRSVGQLAAEQERLQVTLRSIGDAVIATDARARVTDFNTVAEALTGWSAAEAVGRPLDEVFRIIAEDTGLPAPSPVERVLKEGVVVGLANHTALLARDGTRRPIADSGAPIRDAAGRVSGVVLVFRDQTEERRAERALRESEQRAAALFERAPVAISLTRARDGVLVGVNEAFARLFECTREEAVGQTSQALGLSDDASRAAVAAQLGEDGRVRELEVQRRTRDGAALVLSLNIDTVRLGGEDFFLSTVQDLTRRRQTEQALKESEERFRQAQKLESIGRLAGGVAHDFNNLLTVILSCSAELREQVRRGLPASGEDVEEIHAAGERARDLTRQLLAFARKQVVAPVDLDLNALVQGCQRMIARLLGEDLDLQVRLEPGLWALHADPGQVEQVVLNLAVNAHDAMPRGGTLRVQTHHRSTPAGAAGAGDWVCLTVQDSGVGMDAETRAHLFEPFFTTKAPGKGTGLGLATVYGVVTQAGGHVEVHSAPGEGTRFTVAFPRATSAARPPAPAVTTQRVAAGRGTLLLVEDDLQVRGVVERTLKGGGYRVLVADHPRTPLALPDAELRQVALLVTDVVMPEVDGPALARALVRRHPALRVLYVSGYTRDAIADRGGLDGGLELLDKPFTGQALLERVRSILERARTEAGPPC